MSVVKKACKVQKDTNICLVLAAGRSSRMDSFKPLLYWPGYSGTIIGTVLSSVITAGLRAIVVAGYRAEELRNALKDTNIEDFTINRQWASGMLGSIQAGLKRAQSLSGGKNHGCFVCPGDMPFLNAETFHFLDEHVKSWPGSKSCSLFPCYNKKLGHPVWIPFEFIEAINGLAPSAKLRPYLLSRPWQCVETKNKGILLDLDTKEEYHKALLKEGSLLEERRLP